jgi:pimeloyl-ACP methyl ester carboxylesterase
MADFVLVHGAFHGAWCWELVRPELERRGHRTFAMDLPVDQAGKSMDDYAAFALASVAGKAADDALLVGHSMGGRVIPRMAVQRPQARLIMLCAAFAHANEEERLETVAAAAADDFFSWLILDEKGRATMSRENFITAFFQDLEVKQADAAVARLRPQWMGATAEAGAVAPYRDRVAQVIYTTEDRVIDAEGQRNMAAARFGLSAIPLPGGHSPFLGYPVQLAEILSSAAG